MATLLAVAPMITGFPQASSQAQAHPVKSHLRHVGFVKSSVATLRAARNATRSGSIAPGNPDPISTARSGAVSAAQDVSGAVTVVGVTWPKGAVSAGDTYQIRTLSGATWSQWKSLEGEQADGPDRAEAATARAATGGSGGTSPYVVTGASKYEVRSLSTDPAVPTAAKVQVVDPGTSAADSVQQAPGAAAAATVKPTIYTRAAWGANESLRKGVPSYGKIALGFVHHTDSSNSYAASSVPAMIRGMYAYHVQSLGWSDIGYNFVVDRFGRTWEGRAGGMDKPVVGAQTMNYNAVSTGVSAIGNFENTAVPSAMTNAFTRVLAWKLSLSGVPAIGNVRSPLPPRWSTTKYFQRISGHRAGFQTACPGRYLYAKIPAMRVAGARLISAAAARRPAPAARPAVRRPASKPAAAPWAVTRYTAYKGKGLKLGSRGRTVVVLQRAFRLKANGVFGTRTRAAVMSFQTRYHLRRTGVVNRLFWTRLEKRDYPLIAYRRATVRQGNRGRAVIVVQRALRVPVDGIFGPRTKVAVVRVQARVRLRWTGVVSGWTWVAIERQMRR